MYSPPPAQPHRHRVGLPALAGSPPSWAGVRHRLDQGTEECAKGLGVSGLRNAAKSFELPWPVNPIFELRPLGGWEIWV